MHFVSNDKIEHAQTNMLELTTLEQYCNMLFTVSNPVFVFDCNKTVLPQTAYLFSFKYCYMHNKQDILCNKSHSRTDGALIPMPVYIWLDL